MKIFLTSLTLGLISLPALATPGQWVSISSTVAGASNQVEFVQLQTEFPAYFATVNPTQVVSATIAAHDFLYEGDTTCPAGDPRLKKQTASYGICYVNQSPCAYQPDLYPTNNTDPCAP